MTERRGADHWRRLNRSLGIDAQDIHGYGFVVVKVTFVDGLPMQVDTLERVCTRRLDRDTPPIAATVGATQGGRDVV